MPALKASEYVGNYKILKKIGEGGMALIYQAVQPALKRSVVVKKLKDPNREIINRFKKEALLSASFHQENLVSIYDFIYANRSYYLVMEFVDGEDLRTIIDYMSPLPPAMAALITLGIARGLEYTHARNIIHRDIKPSNILISFDGDVKLIDFGVAKDDVSTRLTLTGMIVGTPAYMAPEQANADALNPQSDLFSLGILLYEMLTGLKPFQGENNTEIMARIIRSKFVPAEQINPDIPKPLRQIIKKTLRKDPNRRYQSATELIHDLEKFIPWQLRSRKKESIARLLEKLDKNTTTATPDSLRMAMFSAKPSWLWRALRYSLSLISVYLLVFMVIQFSRLQTGYAALHINDGNYTVQIDDGEINNVNPPLIWLGPIIKGSHRITVRDIESGNIFIAKVPVQPSDTTFIDANMEPGQSPAQLSISCQPHTAQLSLDGYNLGRSPLNELHIHPGFHRLQISHPGYQTLIDQQEFSSHTNYRLHYVLQPE